jgi:hypothetical protein
MGLGVPVRRNTEYAFARFGYGLKDSAKEIT